MANRHINRAWQLRPSGGLRFCLALASVVAIWGLISLSVGCLNLDPMLFWPEKVDEYGLDDRVIPQDRRFEVELRAADGVRVAAVMVQNPSPNGLTVLYCHGTSGHIDEYWDRVESLYLMGFEVLIFDYRGYGKSEGTPSESGLFMDGVAAWQFLVGDMGVAEDRILVYGYSLGGGVASHLAHLYRPAGLVLEATFSNVEDQLVSSTFFNVPRQFAFDATFDNVGKISRMEGFPKLILHGTNDTTFPDANGLRLYRAATPPKWFYLFHGAGHAQVYSSDPERYRHLVCCRAWFPAMGQQMDGESEGAEGVGGAGGAGAGAGPLSGVLARCLDLSSEGGSLELCEGDW